MAKLILEEHIKATYIYLRSIAPFNTWDLPPASKVLFELLDDYEFMGEFDVEPLVIRLSPLRQCTLENLLKTTAHELVHMKLYLEGKTHYDKHDMTFRKYMSQINELYGWDKLDL
jgi:hypothetical protein